MLNKSSKIFYILLILFGILAFLCRDSFAATKITVRDGESFSVQIRVVVENEAKYGLTKEQFNDISTWETGGLGWKVRQCCLQQTHRLGMFSPYCSDGEIEEKYNYCDSYVDSQW